MYDTVGAGSKEFGLDGRKENGGWDERTVAGARAARRDLGDGDLGLWLGGVKKSGVGTVGGKKGMEQEDEEAICRLGRNGKESLLDQEVADTGITNQRLSTNNKAPLFANLTIYINGSTAPMVSDHKLKFLLSEHGARMSIALGRRSVTHVILGVPNSGVGKGAGGGLAGGKIEKELRKVGGKGVKFVSVEW